MFDDLRARLSIRRSTAGIYFELRTLRQMAEIYFTHTLNLPLPADLRPLRRQPPLDPATDDADEQVLTEEQLAAQAYERIQRARLEGRDPGTSYRPDPER